jgi:hypothetical protein
MEDTNSTSRLIASRQKEIRVKVIRDQYELLSEYSVRTKIPMSKIVLKLVNKFLNMSDIQKEKLYRDY